MVFSAYKMDTFRKTKIKIANTKKEYDSDKKSGRKQARTHARTRAHTHTQTHTHKTDKIICAGEMKKEHNK